MNLLKMKSLVALALFGSFSANAAVSVAGPAVLKPTSDLSGISASGFVKTTRLVNGVETPTTLEIVDTTNEISSLAAGFAGKGDEAANSNLVQPERNAIGAFKFADTSGATYIALHKMYAKTPALKTNVMDLHEVLGERKNTITVVISYNGVEIPVTFEYSGNDNSGIVIRVFADNGETKVSVLYGKYSNMYAGPADMTNPSFATSALNGLVATAAIKKYDEAVANLAEIKKVLADQNVILQRATSYGIIPAAGGVAAGGAYADLAQLDAAIAAPAGGLAIAAALAQVDALCLHLGYQPVVGAAAAAGAPGNRPLTSYESFIKKFTEVARKLDGGIGDYAILPAAAPVAPALYIPVDVAATAALSDANLQAAQAAYQAYEVAINAGGAAPAAPAGAQLAIFNMLKMARNPYVLNAKNYGRDLDGGLGANLFANIDTNKPGVSSDAFAAGSYLRKSLIRQESANKFLNAELQLVKDAAGADVELLSDTSRLDLDALKTVFGIWKDTGFGGSTKAIIDSIAAPAAPAVGAPPAVANVMNAELSVQNLLSVSPTAAPIVPIGMKGIVGGFKLKDGVMTWLPAAAAAPAKVIDYAFADGTRFPLSDGSAYTTRADVFGPVQAKITGLKAGVFVPANALTELAGTIRTNSLVTLGDKTVNFAEASLYDILKAFGQELSVTTINPIPTEVSSWSEAMKTAVNKAITENTLTVFTADGQPASMEPTGDTLKNGAGEAATTTTTYGTRLGNIVVLPILVGDAYVTKIIVAKGLITITKNSRDQITDVVAPEAKTLFTNRDKNILAYLAKVTGVDYAAQVATEAQIAQINALNLPAKAKEQAIKALQAGLKNEADRAAQAAKVAAAMEAANGPEGEARNEAIKFLLGALPGTVPAYFAGVWKSMPKEEDFKTVLAVKTQADAEALRGPDVASDNPKYVGGSAEDFFKAIQTFQALVTIVETKPATPETGKTAPATPETGKTAPATPETGKTAPATPETGKTAPATPETGKTAPATPATGKTAPANPSTDDKDNDEEIDAPTDGKDASKGTDSTNTKKPVNTKESGNLKGIVALSPAEIAFAKKLAGKKDAEVVSSINVGPNSVAYLNGNNKRVFSIATKRIAEAKAAETAKA